MPRPCWSATESEVVARDAKMFAAGTNRSVPWEEVARRYFNDKGPLVGTGCYKPPDGLGGDYKGATVGTSPAYSFGSSVCEVAVDMETGKIKIERFTDYHDCGTPINPQMARGQVEGAIVMGAGETIMEEVLFDEKGHILNPRSSRLSDDDHQRCAGDLQRLCRTPTNPRVLSGPRRSAKGPRCRCSGAVAHAIANATGVWIKELPITPERIRKALNAASPANGGPLQVS